MSSGTWPGVIGVAAVLLALTGCASRGSVREVRGQVATVREQVEQLRKQQEASARELAKTVTEFKGIEGQVASLAQAQKETAERVERVDTRSTETEQSVRGIRSSVEGLSHELARRATASSLTDNSAAPEWPSRSGAAEQLYARALGNFRAREHGQAVLEFTDFIARYPQHELVGTAQFWIGEAYYLERDYRQALVEYGKVVDLNSQGGKAADALLKIGLCFRALNEPGRALDTWQQLVQAYPDSDAARRARGLIQARLAPVGRTR